MSCDPCPAIRVLRSMSCDPCPAIHVLLSMSCYPCLAIHVLLSMSCDPCPAIQMIQDERLPVPAELGRVDAQEDPGSAGERWQRHQILARWHIHVSCFLQNKNRIKTNDFTCFFIDLTFFVTSTVHEQSILIQNFVIFLLKAIVIYIKIIVASLTKTAGTEDKKNTRYVHKLKGQ